MPVAKVEDPTEDDATARLAFERATARKISRILGNAATPPPFALHSDLHIKPVIGRKTAITTISGTLLQPFPRGSAATVGGVNPSKARAGPPSKRRRVHSDEISDTERWKRFAAAERILRDAIPLLRDDPYVDRRSDIAHVASELTAPAGDTALLQFPSEIQPHQAMDASEEVGHVFFSALGGDGPDLTFRLRFQVEDAVYCWTLDFSETVWTQMAYAGLVPIGDCPAGLAYMMMGRSGHRRSLLEFDSLRVGKRVKKLSSKYELAFNHDFSGVLKGIDTQHPENWMSPPIQTLLLSLWAQSTSTACAGVAATPSPPRGAEGSVRVCSVELRAKDTDEVVAGEVGFCVGSTYTSLSGFRKAGTQSCGTVQLVATALALKAVGFAYWDLDQPLPYKTDLGAVTVDRKTHLQRFRRHRDDAPPPIPTTRLCVATLVKSFASPK